MARHTARIPGFSRLAAAIKTHWYKKKVARQNRKALRQAKDIEEFLDKKLDPWSLD